MSATSLKYSTTVNPRPNDDIDPKNKDQRWMLDWSKYIYSYGMKGNNTPFSQASRIKLNRKFAAGKQDPDKYLRRLSQGHKQEGPIGQTDNGEGAKSKRKGFMNIDKAILPIFPKYLNLLIGKYSGIDHDITAEASDEMSGDEREETKWNAWFEANQRGVLDNYYASLGAPTQSQSNFKPQSIEEMEFYSSLGGFKLKHEIAMETIINHSFDVSSWSDTIKRKMFKDLIENNIACVKDYFDITTNKVKATYLDPAKLIVPETTENEYLNPEFYGYIKLYRSADLRLRGIGEEKIKGYAKNFASRYGNESWNGIEAIEANYDGGAHSYDEFLIPVLECEWESVDTYYDQVVDNKKGQTKIHEEFYDVGKKIYDCKKYENRKDKSIQKTDVKNLYQCNWVLESDDIFGYGKVYDTIRKDNEVKSSVHVYKLYGQSILERSIPNLEQIQIGWLKFQNAVALAAPPGVAVEFDAISNISTGVGEDTFHPLEILQLRSDTGNFIYKLTAMGMGGINTRGNAGKPIEELSGGLGNALGEFNDLFQVQLGMIQQNTGISPSADASAPKQNQSVKGEEFALSATNNTLKPLYDAYLSIKGKVADNFTYRAQILVQESKDVYKAYYPVLGKHNLQTLKTAGKLSASSFGIKIEPAATDQMKIDIKDQIKIGMQVGREGQSSLAGSTGLMLLNMIESGKPLKLVSSLLQYYENQEKKRLQEKEQANISLQGEEKRKSDEAAAKLAKDAKDEDHQRLKELEDLKTKNTLKVNRELHDQKMLEIQADVKDDVRV